MFHAATVHATRRASRALALFSFAAAVACFAGTEAVSETVASDKDAGVIEKTDTGHFARLPFRVSVGVRGGYDDNVLTAHFNRQGSGFVNSSIDFEYEFGSPRTKIELNAGGGYTYYFERLGERDYDVSSYLGLRLSHRATPRLTLSASVYAAYQSQPNFSVTGALNRRSGNYFYSLDKFSVAYLWTPRFSTVTSYTFGTLQYDDSRIGAFEDRFEHTLGQEFRYLWQPTTTIVAEYRLGFVDYDMLDRDSTTHYALAGFDHSFSPRLNVSVRGGAEFRFYDNNDDRSAPYFEGALNYALGKTTSVSWTNRYSIEEPDLPGSPSRTTYRTGLQVKYGITPRWSATLGAYYQHDENDGVRTATAVSPAFTEDAFDIALAVRYAITHNFSVEAGYTHTEVLSDFVLREYARNRFFGGLVLSF